jgi:hypothetical protein
MHSSGHKNILKWGVIDSAGNVIVPFICDGIKAVSEHQGIAAVYRHSWPLNTGIPRYEYYGWYFDFDKSGINPSSKREFTLTFTFAAYYDPEKVTESGPDQFITFTE